MGGPTVEQKKMFKRRSLAEDKAAKRAMKNRRAQEEYANIPIHHLSIDATPDELIVYYRSVRKTYSEVSSAVLPVDARLPTAPECYDWFDTGGVPVTTPPPTEVKDYTFQITELFDPLDPTAPVLQIAVQQFSGYAMAVRALYLDSDPVLQVWYAFTGAELQLPKHLFRNVLSCPYKLAYDEVYILFLMSSVREINDAISIHNLILREIFQYFVEYQKTAVELFLKGKLMEGTTAGQTYKDTIFFLIGECQRFFVLLSPTWRSVRFPFLRFSLSDISWGNLLIHNWREFSKAIEALWLAIYEAENGIPFEGSLQDALKLLQVLEGDFSTLTLRNAKGKYCLDLLAGSLVQLLNCDLTIIKKVLMRMDGFDGEFYVPKPASRSSALQYVKREAFLLKVVVLKHHAGERPLKLSG